jgi:hypothetical protein
LYKRAEQVLRMVKDFSMSIKRSCQVLLLILEELTAKPFAEHFFS